MHSEFMLRCIDLARNGIGKVSPNPLVGSVIVYENKIIGEGWHQQYGGPHAEVNAINSVKDKNLLASSTLYVNLEPCSHFGKTPPCADLIIEEGIKKVVIGMIDPYIEVAGSGITKLKNAGIEVTVGVEEVSCVELNKRFVTYVNHHRPYIILKWAQTRDGFLAPDKSMMTDAEFEEKRHITGFVVQKLVHKWRTEEDAIMIGTNTVLTDNPALNARAWPEGNNPVRIILDNHLRIPNSYKIFDHSQRTIVFTSKDSRDEENLIFKKIKFNIPIWSQVFNELYLEKIQSVIIEGGEKTLISLINEGFWDEAQVFVTPKLIGDGVKAPKISGNILKETTIDGSQLTIYTPNK